MDMLDMVFRLERMFRIKVEWNELERYALSRQPPDLLVSDLLTYVRTKRPPFPIIDGAIAMDVPCVKCRYNLRGLPPSTNCPECGTPAEYDGQLRVGVEELLQDALGVKREQIRDDASLV